MIRSFGDSETELVYKGFRCKKIPPAIQNVARRKLRMIAAAAKVVDLRVPPGNRLEALSGDRSGQWSIRVNDRFRVCFEWANGAAYNVEIVDYH